MKGLHFIFTWTTFLILFEPYHDPTESCVHENFQPHSLVEMHVRKLWESDTRRQKRHKQHSDDQYSAIRITTLYSMDQYLSPDEEDALKQVIERAVRRISSVLSVISVDGPLLLPRTACPVVFRNGINKGKCARIQKGYTGEYCLDTFKIPSDHLEGFAIYNRTYPDPVKIYYEDGPGLPDTDFVLYVTSLTTHLCNPYKTSALAYAAYCRLDDSGRPIAGQVNFCPRIVKAQKFDKELLYKTAVHELFHALGFSNKLFDKYQSCNDDGVCEPWPKPMVKPVDGIMRLVTKAVVREMKKHFNCTSEPEFGGPIEVTNGRVSSHWEPVLMHSSVMGSKEQKPYLTLIDPISLAVFEDSGWYKVNYSQADTFIWGQGQGCSFGLPGSCKTQEGFCVENVTGCHHLRLSKARCNVNTNMTSTCGVFAADQRPCFQIPANISSVEEEIFSSESRCFLSSLTPAHSLHSVQNHHKPKVTGKCYERKCENNDVYVRVRDGEWLLCHPESYIQVEGFEGSVHCPKYDQICTDFMHPEPPADMTTSRTTVVSETTPNTTSAYTTTTKGTSGAVLIQQSLSTIIGLLVSIAKLVLS